MKTLTGYLGLAAALCCALAIAGCGDEATETAEACARSNLVEQCPPGSNPILGAEADSSCGGSLSVDILYQDGEATGQCKGTGSCNVICQFASPCTCGVDRVTDDGVFCAACPSCGDGLCDIPEAQTCEGVDDRACHECPGDCTGTEFCTPNEAICAGSMLRICNGAGSAYAIETDCADSGQVCGQGACVMAGVCGNTVCEEGETQETCPSDCQLNQECQPNATLCEGTTLVRCNAAGVVAERTECAAQAQVCGNGQCQQPGVCGNGVCEGDEANTCAQDCDNATCGNDLCESGEPETCPQDCAELVCVPGRRTCNGPQLTVCSPSGQSETVIDCNDYEQTCGRGNCMPVDECGNGVCESGEFSACAADCAEECGNGFCGGDESFDTCADDCEPECGDQLCQGSESNLTCPQDCTTTCNNGTCEASEDRSTCPNDCGYCGDGVCEDGVETPGGTEGHCRIDCVAIACSDNTDCDDRIGCTNDACVAGSCVYTPVDASCGTNEKCLGYLTGESSGCCADADGDGFASSSCGGGDCDDADGDVRPGAPEPCGGGDRNCDGRHRPALANSPVQLTSNFSTKSNLDVASGGGRTFLVWRGIPESEPRLEYMVLGGSANPVVAEVPGATPAGVVNTAYSPQSDRAGVSWNNLGAPAPGFFNFILADGSIELDTDIQLNDRYDPTGMVWIRDMFVATNNGFFWVQPNNQRFAQGWDAISEAGGVTTPFNKTAYERAPGAVSPVVTDSQVVGIRRDINGSASTQLVKVDPTVADDFVLVESGAAGVSSPTTGVGKCRLGWDGALLVQVCASDGVLHYNRLAPNGLQIFTAEVENTSAVPADIATSTPAGDALPNVGVLTLEAASNLFLFVRSQDGAEVLPTGLIAGGNNVSDAHIFHDGRDFIVYWLAESSGVQQVFQQRVACE